MKFIRYRAEGLTVIITPQNIYPTLGSINEVFELADSKIPMMQRNEMFSLLMTFQNTLLNQLEKINASK